MWRNTSFEVSHRHKREKGKKRKAHREDYKGAESETLRLYKVTVWMWSN